jgi:hypothetical protein
MPFCLGDPSLHVYTYCLRHSCVEPGDRKRTAPGSAFVTIDMLRLCLHHTEGNINKT